MRPTLSLLFLFAVGCGGSFTLAAAGDLQLGAQRTRDPLATLPTFLVGDVRFVNLEGPLDDGCTSETHGRSDEARWLRGRIDVVSLANNHRDDCGARGHTETVRALAAHGVRVVDEAPLRHHGIVFFARHYPPNASLTDEALLAAIRRERSPVVVSLHWGHTNTLLPTAEQRAFARELIEAGTRLIIGHGPHTAMGVERVRTPHHEGVVAYSLGNLAFDCACTDARDAFTIAARFVRGRVDTITLRPFRAGLGEPPARVDDPELRDLFLQLSADLGTTLSIEANGDLVWSRHPPGAAGPHQAPSVAGSAR